MTATTTPPILLVERRGPVLVLTINRPEKRNAVNQPLREAFHAAIRDAGLNPEVRAVVITGTGETSFVAGVDLTELVERTPVEQQRIMRPPRIFDAIERLPMPVIAAVNGVCLGAGLELALACDIRLATPGARFGQPEVKLGIIPGGGGTQRLPRMIGQGAALRMILTGDPVDAAEAHRLGLVQEIVPFSALLDRAVALGEQIAQNSPVAVAAAKQAVRAALGVSFEAGFRLETSLFLQCFASEDRAEGIRAFLDKRPPAFPGR